MEGLILTTPPCDTDILNAKQLFPLTSPLDVPVGTHVEENKLAVAEASGPGSPPLRGSGEGPRGPGASLQSGLQTTDGGGASTRRPVGAAVQVDLSGLPQSDARTTGRPLYSKGLLVSL